MQVGGIPPVDLIPALAWIPEMFFGNGKWKTKLHNLGRSIHEYYTPLTKAAKARFAEGGGDGTLVQTACEKQKEYKLTEKMIGLSRFYVYLIGQG